MALPWSFLLLLFVVSAAQNMTTSLLTLLFSKSLEPQQTAAFWLFMSWVYWFSPVSGWLSDVCGSRKAMLVFGLICNIGTWYTITFAAFSYKMFIVVGLFQNAAMLFVNSAINGALVEIAQRDGKKRITSQNSSGEEEEEKEEDDHDDVLASRQDPLLINASRPSSVVSVEEPEEEDGETDNHSAASDVERPANVEQEVSAVDPSSMLNESGATQSKAMLARSMGSVVGAVIQTFILVYLDIRPALAISSAVFGLAAVAAVFTQLAPDREGEGGDEENDQEHGDAGAQQQMGRGGADADVSAARPDQDSFCSRIRSLFQRLRQLCDANRGKGQRSAAADVMILLVFIFCNNMLPDATGFYQQYVFEAFSFPNWFNSCFQLGNLVGALTGCEVYRRWLAPLSQTSVFVAGCLAAAFSYATGIAFATGFTRDELHLPNPAYLMVDSFVVGFLNRISFMPVLHVASSRCPRGFEAVVFELFSLAAMGGATVASVIAIKVADALHISRADWGNLWLLMTVAAISRLLPLLVVPHLPPPVRKEESDALQNCPDVVDQQANPEREALISVPAAVQ